MNPRGAGAVFLREAFRSARRMSTYALRLGFSTALLGLVLLTAWTRLRLGWGVEDWGGVGRELFEAFTVLQLVLAAALAPLLVAGGLVEEIEAGTLDLLVLTRLRTGDLLWGKVVSRLLVLATLILGAIPAVALITTLGGVGVWEVVAAATQTLVVVVCLGAVGGVAGILTRSTVIAAAVAWAWGALAFLVVPFAYAISSDIVGHPGREEELLAHLSPLFGLWATDGWLLGPALTLVPALAVLAQLAVPLFRIESTGGDWALSPDIWTWEATKRRGRLSTVVVIGSLVFLCAGGGWPLGDTPAWVAVLLLFTVAQAWTLAMVIEVVWTLARRARALERLAVPGGGWLGRRRRWADPDAPPRRLLGEVWSNPVAWRELATRVRGPARWGVPATFALWGVAVGFMLLVEGMRRGTGEVAASIGLFSVIGIAWLSATGSMVEDRQRGTLATLAPTTLSGARLVLGKLAGPMARAAPLIVAAVLLFELTRSDGFSVWAMGWTTAWAATTTAWLATACLVIALRVPVPRLAWPVSAVLCVGWFLAPTFLEESRHLDLDWLAEIWFPPLDGQQFSRDPDNLVAWSAAAHAGLTLMAGSVLAGRWRPWSAR